MRLIEGPYPGDILSVLQDRVSSFRPEEYRVRGSPASFNGGFIEDRNTVVGRWE